MSVKLTRPQQLVKEGREYRIRLHLRPQRELSRRWMMLQRMRKNSMLIPSMRL